MSEESKPKRPGPPEEYRWKKGQSGNPGGRPKGQSVTAAIRDILDREHNGRKIGELIAERLVKEALAGKFPFAKEVLDRAEGKVAERQDVTVRRGVDLLRDAAEMTDEELIEQARAAGMLDLLSPRLRMIADRQTDPPATET